jgi:hypothetical protein
MSGVNAHSWWKGCEDLAVGFCIDGIRTLHELARLKDFAASEHDSPSERNPCLLFRKNTMSIDVISLGTISNPLSYT